MIRTSIGIDGERIVAERCLEQCFDVLTEITVSCSHSLFCTEDHLHHHRSSGRAGQPVRHHCFRLVHQNYWQGIDDIIVFFRSCVKFIIYETTLENKFRFDSTVGAWNLCICKAVET